MSQPWLTRLSRHPRHVIEKKMRLSKEEPSKKN
jgi:hypothetical protein